MPDFNPRVLRRMLTLRQFPLFSGAELEELATIAENVVEEAFPTGAVIAAGDARMPALQLVVEGRIETRGPGDAVAAFGPREVFGELEVLAARKTAAPGVAVVPTRTLVLTASDVNELLEDNFGLLLSALRDLATRMVAHRGWPARRTPGPPPRAGTFGLVERLIVLRQHVPFARGHLQALAMLAHASEEVTWPAGTTIARRGDLAIESVTIIEGELRARGASGRWHALGPGDAIGQLETLAGLRHDHDVEATTTVRALRSGDTAIFDVLEDHTDFALAMLASLAGALLDRSALAPAASHAATDRDAIAVN